MGHAMHTVRREEKRRNREEDDDPGGGGGGDDDDDDEQGGKDDKESGKGKKAGPSVGRVRLKGALLQTYVLSILIRSIMEVNADAVCVSGKRFFQKEVDCQSKHETKTMTGSFFN